MTTEILEEWRPVAYTVRVKPFEAALTAESVQPFLPEAVAISADGVLAAMWEAGAADFRPMSHTWSIEGDRVELACSGEMLISKTARHVDTSRVGARESMRARVEQLIGIPTPA